MCVCVFRLLIAAQFIVQAVDVTSAEKTAISLVNAQMLKRATGSAKGVHPGLEVGANMIFTDMKWSVGLLINYIHVFGYAIR